MPRREKLTRSPLADPPSPYKYKGYDTAVDDPTVPGGVRQVHVLAPHQCEENEDHHILECTKAQWLRPDRDHVMEAMGVMRYGKSYITGNCTLCGCALNVELPNDPDRSGIKLVPPKGMSGEPKLPEAITAA